MINEFLINIRLFIKSQALMLFECFLSFFLYKKMKLPFKTSVRIKNKLNSNSLIELINNNFALIKDKREDNKSISLPNILMSSYSMFSLKHPSLLSFSKKYSNDKQNLESVFKISKIPSDNEMRDVIDEVSSADIKAIFPKIFKRLQRSKDLLKFLFMGKYYLISGDGTEYFKSNKIACVNCMQRNLKDGSTQNYHQFYGSAIVHPDMKEVIPLAPEPIIRQDGNTKNDCERNASKRWLADFRKAHPKLSGIIIEDALSSNAPHIREIMFHHLRFILGVKEADHKFLFEYVSSKKKSGDVIEYSIIKGTKTHIFSFINNVPLNKSNQDLLLNFLEYWEVDNKTGKTQHFSWVTDLKIKIQNVYDIMRGGRARWKIENETFNTLKNQDYHFEHNYGHGKKNLSVNLGLLMMLAFLIDQTLEISCDLFQRALKKNGSRIALWSETRELFNTYICDSMNQIYEAIVFGYEKQKIEILNSG